MSPDRELLELAAKAADLGFMPSRDSGSGIIGGVLHKPWNPLTDDGDALRLAVKLEIEEISWFPAAVTVNEIGICECIPYEGDPYSATRRAIVRAAAAIGKAMP